VFAALGQNAGSLRMVRIWSMAHLQELEVSGAHLPEVEGRADLVISGQGR
jgi:hypothetical protein